MCGGSSEKQQCQRNKVLSWFLSKTTDINSTRQRKKWAREAQVREEKRAWGESEMCFVASFKQPAGFAQQHPTKTSHDSAHLWEYDDSWRTKTSWKTKNVHQGRIGQEKVRKYYKTCKVNPKRCISFLFHPSIASTEDQEAKEPRKSQTIPSEHSMLRHWWFR